MARTPAEAVKPALPIKSTRPLAADLDEVALAATDETAEETAEPIEAVPDEAIDEAIEDDDIIIDDEPEAIEDMAVADESKLESIEVDEAWAATEDGMIDEAPEAVAVRGTNKTLSQIPRETGQAQARRRLRLTATAQRLLEGDGRRLVSGGAVGNQALGSGRLEGGR